MSCLTPVLYLFSVRRIALQGFESNRFRETVRKDFSKDRTAQRYLAMTKALGRVPLLTEFKALPCLLDRYGFLQRIERIAESLTDGDALVSTREEKRSNFLTYIAMLHLQSLTLPPIRSLPNLGTPHETEIYVVRRETGKASIICFCQLALQ